MGVRRWSLRDLRRTPFVVSVVLALAAPAGAQEPPPPLRATLAACEAGPQPAERFAVFTGSMPAIAGTARMWMRFDLLERRETSKRWRRLRAPALGRWERSKEAGASGFIYTKRVERLKQRARYRAVVRFRWFDAHGRVQRETRRTTPVCVQPWQRPNLRIESVEVRPATDPAMARYLVTIVNDGLTAAGPFTVGLVVGAEEDVRDVPGLAATGRTTLEIPGRRCDPARPDRIAVQLDIRDVVRESSERDNRSDRACDGR